ncbi:MAG: ABC transporter permease [Pseudomonadota bacterium]
MIVLLRTEARKLRGSLALALAVAAPALPGLLSLLAMASGRNAPAWSSIFGFAIPIWAMFLLPMTVAASTALIAQIEHRAHGWDHLLALPISRWQLFAAKLVVVAGVVAAMTVAMAGFTILLSMLGGLIRGEMPLGAIPWVRTARSVGYLLSASAMLVVVQLWSALRFANFVVPLGVGIGGTMVALAVAIVRTDKADYFPWVLPLNTLSGDDPALYATIGGIGGCALAVVMIVALARHSFR